jgi:hypothetical protein
MPNQRPLSDARFECSLPLSLAPTEARREYRARLIAPGPIRAQGNRPSNLVIPADTLMAALAAGHFNSKPTFIDHPDWFEYPSLRNLAGITLGAAEMSSDDAIYNTIRLYPNAAGNIVADLFDAILQDAAHGDPVPDVGLSAVLWPRWERVEYEDGEESVWEMSEIRHVESIDFVFEPGADGRVESALAALRAIVASEARQSLGPTGGQASEDLGPNPVASAARQSLASEARQSTELESQSQPRRQIMPEDISTTEPTTTVEVSPAPPEVSLDASNWLQSLRVATADALISSSGLPSHAQARLRTRDYPSPADVQAAIDAEREYLANLVQDTVVQVGGAAPRGARYSVGPNGLEQVQLALEALMAGRRPADGIAALSGIREAYHLLSGDFEMTGVFHPDRIYLANVTTTTMAALTANALNKVVVNMFATYPHWWAPAVTEMDFTSLQDVRWTTLGGVGELPTVAEGAAYTELTWDDQVETDAFVKKGGYLGLTLEAIDKDDTGRLQAAPRALAQSAWLTLGKAIAEIFTVNSAAGPTMSDGGALFNATAVTSAGGHANLLTTALSAAQFEVVSIAMMKAPELHSGERLGALTRPRLIWVPVDLEATALQILASENQAGQANWDINVEADADLRSQRLRDARRRVIVVPFWTDATDWAAQADPNLYPSIGIGYRYGRTPEIFSVASPTAGLMFSNDTLPVKVRFFFAVGPIDWRGLHKSNCS